MTTARIALGSNRGPRLYYIETALALVKNLGKLGMVSSLYLTEPVAVAGGWFVNCAVELLTKNRPTELLKNLLQIECRLGRVREPVEKRTIDLDIIFYGQEIVEQDNLIIPHPRAHQRRFVLLPLMEICPEYVHPIEGKSINQLLCELEDSSKVYKIEPNLTSNQS